MQPSILLQCLVPGMNGANTMYMLRNEESLILFYIS